MDSRFHLNVSFSIYGKTYLWDSSLNWHSESGEIDQRISEWFLEKHDEALSAFIAKLARGNEKQLKQEIEDGERRQLANLKAKYESA